MLPEMEKKTLHVGKEYVRQNVSLEHVENGFGNTCVEVASNCHIRHPVAAREVRNENNKHVLCPRLTSPRLYTFLL